MAILWGNLAIVFIFSYFSRYFATATIASSSTVFIKPNKVLVLGALLSLILIAGLRANIGDTPAYMHSYVTNNMTWDFVKSQKDIGFGILQMVLKKYSKDPQVLVFITAMITNVLIIHVFYKYSRMFELSTYVYIANGFFLTSMNGIRQCLAAAIIFAATKFLIEGSFKRYLLVVLLATTIHESALILIFIYFIVRRKAWTWTTFSLIFLAIFIVLGFNQFTEVLFAALKDTQYSGYKNFSEGGANIVRVAVDAVPLVIAYLGREKLRGLSSNSDYIVNMAILGFIFMIISTQNWIFARFSIYFNLYEIILISWIVKLFSERSQRLIYFAIIVFFFIYHYYETVITLNIIYKSDFFDFLFK